MDETFDPSTVSATELVGALDNAVRMGWLKPVDHGYCFYCAKEGSVYEITDEDAPAQPPRCEKCFLSSAFKILNDSVAMKRVQEMAEQTVIENNDEFG